MTDPSETLILCEGYHDRAFWAGWLAHLGCSTDGFSPNSPGYPRQDPWGGKIGGGQFAFTSPSGHFLRVVPCQGKDKLRPAARARLRERQTKTLARLILNVDPDTDAASSTPPAGIRAQDVLTLAREFDPAAQILPNGDIHLEGGATKVSLVRWEATDPPAPGLPNQQTLERLACAAVVAAYPARAGAVQSWLDARPAAPAAGPKEHAWSYMAGWYGEHGCQDFYENLWRDPRIVEELQSRLLAAGAWPLVAKAAQ